MKFKSCINYADFIASQLKTCLYGISNCSMILHMLYITWTIHFVLLNVGEIFFRQISFLKDHTENDFFVGYSNRWDGIEYFGAHDKNIKIWSTAKKFQSCSFPLPPLPYLWNANGEGKRCRFENRLRHNQIFPMHTKRRSTTQLL